jgi:hypothetical protein
MERVGVAALAFLSLPQPDAGAAAVLWDELYAGSLDGGTDSRQIVCRGHSATFLEVPDGALAEVGAPAQFGLRPIQQASGSTGLGGSDRHR